MIAPSMVLMVLMSFAEQVRSPVLTNSWRGLKPGVATRQDVIGVLGAPNRVSQDVIFAKVEGLELLSYDDLVVSVFLKMGRVLVMVISARDGSDFPERVAIWEAELGRPLLRLPSSRGKNSHVNVYSTRGLAATEVGARILFVEIFQSMSADQYERTLYKKPPVFVR
jgi:hypothetical protein